MGRHTAPPTQPVQVPPEPSRQPDPRFGPITDPLLLDAVERELGRTRTGSHAVAAPAPIRAAGTRAGTPATAAVPAQPAVADDEDAVDDGAAPPSQPVRVQFGTRVPMVFLEEDEPEEDPAVQAGPPATASFPPPFPRPAQGAAWSAVDPAPDRSFAPPASEQSASARSPFERPAEEHRPFSGLASLTEPAPQAAEHRYPSAPDPVTEPIAPARAIPLGAQDTGIATRKKQGNPLTFWIVVGVSMIAVLTLVALLPF